MALALTLSLGVTVFAAETGKEACPYECGGYLIEYEDEWEIGTETCPQSGDESMQDPVIGVFAVTECSKCSYCSAVQIDDYTDCKH